MKIRLYQIHDEIIYEACVLFILKLNKIMVRFGTRTAFVFSGSTFKHQTQTRKIKISLHSNTFIIYFCSRSRVSPLCLLNNDIATYIYAIPSMSVNV